MGFERFFKKIPGELDNLIVRGKLFQSLGAKTCIKRRVEKFVCWTLDFEYLLI